MKPWRDTKREFQRAFYIAVALIEQQTKLIPTLEEGKLFNACKARAVPKQYRIPCNPLSILKQSISPKGCIFFRHAYFCQRAYFGLCEDLALKHEESADLEECGYI